MSGERAVPAEQEPPRLHGDLGVVIEVLDVQHRVGLARPVDVALDVLDATFDVRLQGFGGLEVPEGDVHLH